MEGGSEQATISEPFSPISNQQPSPAEENIRIKRFPRYVPSHGSSRAYVLRFLGSTGREKHCQLKNLDGLPFKIFLIDSGWCIPTPGRKGPIHARVTLPAILDYLALPAKQ